MREYVSLLNSVPNISENGDNGRNDHCSSYRGDTQEDFCSPHGSLAIDKAKALAPVINGLLDSPGFALKLATQDFHPPDHVSFASQHTRAEGGQSSFSIANPENAAEEHLLCVQNNPIMDWHCRSSIDSSLWPDHCVQGTSDVKIISEIDQTKF
jgi:nicotinamidase-related amidase